MPHVKGAFDWFDSNIKLFTEKNVKSLLYVGWTLGSSTWWYTNFCKKLSIEKVGVVEVYNSNYILLQKWIKQNNYNIQTFNKNILEIEKYISNQEYDIIFWDHGPEHVTLENLQIITPKLISTANKALIYACPWGEWPQDAIGSNIFEKHLINVEESTLTNLGLQVYPINKINQGNEGELIGVYLK